MLLYPTFPIRRELLPLHKLAYLEGVRNYTFLHFQDGSCRIYAKTLKVFEDGLPADDFVRVSKQHLIKRDFISHYNSREVLLANGLILPISRRRRVNLSRRRRVSLTCDF